MPPLISGAGAGAGAAKMLEAKAVPGKVVGLFNKPYHLILAMYCD
jgi:hypothetical protein